jgi:hypothetical protein
MGRDGSERMHDGVKRDQQRCNIFQYLNVAKKGVSLWMG